MSAAEVPQGRGQAGLHDGDGSGVVLAKLGLGSIDSLVPLDGVARQVLEHPMRGSCSAVVRYHIVSAK